MYEAQYQPSPFFHLILGSLLRIFWKSRFSTFPLKTPHSSSARLEQNERERGKKYCVLWDEKKVFTFARNRRWTLVRSKTLELSPLDYWFTASEAPFTIKAPKDCASAPSRSDTMCLRKGLEKLSKVGGHTRRWKCCPLFYSFLEIVYSVCERETIFFWGVISFTLQNNIWFLLSLQTTYTPNLHNHRLLFFLTARPSLRAACEVPRKSGSWGPMRFFKRPMADLLGTPRWLLPQDSFTALNKAQTLLFRERGGKINACKTLLLEFNSKSLKPGEQKGADSSLGLSLSSRCQKEGNLAGPAVWRCN